MRKPTKLIAAIAVLLLLAAAIGIAIHLQPDPQKQTELGAHPAESEAKPSPSGPARQPETPRSADGPDVDEQPKPPNDAPGEERQTMPVRWMTEPLEIPPEGIPFELRNSHQKENCTGGRVFKDHAVFSPLPDGSYTWATAAPLKLATTHGGHGRYSIIVESAKISVWVGRPSAKLPAIPLYYMVPVRLVANLTEGAEVAVTVLCVPDNSEDSFLGSTYRLRHMQEQEVHVPRGRLMFRRAHGGAAQPNAPMTSSLGDRLPQANERIVLTPAATAKLVLTVVGQTEGWLERELNLPEDPADELTKRRPTVQIKGWNGERGETSLSVPETLAQLTSIASGSFLLNEITLSLTPLTEDATVCVELRAPMTSAIWSYGLGGKLIAFGEATLSAHQSHYSVDLTAVVSTGVVTVKVRDENGLPRAFQPVEARSLMSGKQGAGLSYRGTLYSDGDGLIRFERVPVAPGAGLSLVCKHVRTSVYFAEGETTAEAEIVLDSDTVQPLVFEFIADALSEDERWRVEPRVQANGMLMRPGSSEVKYAITTTSRNSLMSATGKSHLDNRWWLYTDYVEPGPYTAILETPYGQYTVTGTHNRLASETVKVRLEPSKQVSITCVDADGKSLEQVVFWTTPQDAREDWGRAGDVAREYDPKFSRGRPITNKDGKATIWCRTARADPATWGYYHPDHGLMRVTQAGAPDEAGFRITLAPAGGDTATVIVKTPHGKGQCRIVLRLYGPEDIFDARTNLGAVKPLEGEEVVFQGVPPGSYEIKLFEFVEKGYTSPPKENCIRIEVPAGGTQTVTLPYKD